MRQRPLIGLPGQLWRRITQGSAEMVSIISKHITQHMRQVGGWWVGTDKDNSDACKQGTHLRDPVPLYGNV